MAQVAFPPLDPPREDHDDIVILRGATWADYERLLTVRGDEPVPRLAFLRGQVELMNPSKTHESRKSVIGHLVVAWCLEHDVDISAFGSWTLTNPAAERGAEPDECYIVGERDADLPDIAIEVVHTGGGINKLEIYRKLGVREVWIYERGTFCLYTLRGEGYEAISASEILPGIDFHHLASFVPMHPMTRAVRAYRESLREARSRRGE